MGVYFNPPEALTEVGRKLEGVSWGELVAQLKEGEVLVGHYQWWPDGFHHCPQLYNQQEYDGFESIAEDGFTIASKAGEKRYGGGHIRYRHGFYAVPEGLLPYRREQGR